MSKHFLSMFFLLFFITGLGCGGHEGPEAFNPLSYSITDPDDNPDNGGNTSWDVNAFDHVYEVGPDQDYEDPSEIPWDELTGSTIVRIHFRSEPYRTKWVVTTAGTRENPLVITGLPENGLLPVISGEDALTRPGLYYLNEARSVIKVGNYTGSGDSDIPSFVHIENLDIRSARPAYGYTDRYGNSDTYSNNAAAVHVEEGDNITIEGCRLHDCGNGLFSSHFTHDLLISGNYIYDNGIEGRIYEHNTYTESMGIIYQYNRFGPLRTGCLGNNLKDRSAGTVIRYNWIESGNRQLDLVDTSYASFFLDPTYQETFVYGNILIEPDGAGNSQMIHYGGDSNDNQYYRRGVIYLYNNTIISTRDGNTTLIRLATDDVTADIRNNIIYTTASPGHLALTNGHGIVHLYHNWMTENYRDTFESTSPAIVGEANNITGTDPGFTDFYSEDYRPSAASGCLDLAGAIASEAAAHPPSRQYVSRQSYEERVTTGLAPDIGALEAEE